MRKLIIFLFFQVTVSLFSQDWNDFIVINNFRPAIHDWLITSGDTKIINVDFWIETEDYFLIRKESLPNFIRTNNWVNIIPSILQKEVTESTFIRFYDDAIRQVRSLDSAIIEFSFPRGAYKNFHFNKELFVILLWERPQWKAFFFER